jgi:hypothetical protein
MKKETKNLMTLSLQRDRQSYEILFIFTEYHFKSILIVSNLNCQVYLKVIKLYSAIFDYLKIFT